MTAVKTEDVPSSPQLRLEAVTAGYGKKGILNGLSLEVRPGEITVLIGSNGAGKSTLLKVAMGLLDPWSGSVWIDDEEITGVRAHKRVRLGLAYLIQGGKVFSSLTVGENLELGTLLLSRERRSSAKEHVLDLFPALRKRMSVRAGLLSGGQRQALSLSMLLAQQPRVLLLDEPSAGLSPKVAQDILSAISELNRSLGITILLVEQRVREALEIAHRAVVLANGVIAAETRSPSEWLQEGALDGYFFAKVGAAKDGAVIKTSTEVRN